MLRKKINVKIINKSNNPLPEYQTAGSAGMDLRANIINSVIILPNERVIIPTGIHIQLPDRYEAQIRPRSGLSFKYGITVLNTPGTIDSDYIGEIKVILYNTSNKSFTVHNGDRIAQMIFNKYERANLIEVEKLKPTVRGSGGFGHTKIK